MRSRRARQSPFERYRGWIIGASALAGALILGFVLFQSGSAQPYICDTQLTPGPTESVTPRPSVLATPTPGGTVSPGASPTGAASPTAGASASPVAPGTPGATETPPATGSPTATGSPSAPGSPSASASPSASGSPSVSPSAQPSPAPDPTPRLGFTTEIIGRTHVRTGTTIDYPFCPPTSGDHFNDPPRGPIQPNVYPPNEERNPGGWVHNLEHGYVVLLYRCPGGAAGAEGCPTQAQLDQMRTWYETAAQPPSGCPKKVLVARFDSMSTPFALVSWGRALLMNDFNLDTALTFAQQWMEHESLPEGRTC